MPLTKTSDRPKSGSRLPADFNSLVRLHPPQAIQDDVACANTQEMIDRLTALPALTPGQSEYLHTLTILFDAYEQEHERIETRHLSPIDALRFLLRSNSMTASDLGRLLGNRELGPKILNGTRQLSKAHIRLLARRFNVDAGLFL